MSFEQDYNRLQEIVKQLEEGDLASQEISNCFRRASACIAVVRRN